MKRKLLFLLLFVFAYAQSQQLQSVLYQNWQTSDWENWFRQEFVYDANGDVTLYSYQVWDAATVSWKNSSQSLVTNESGQPVQYINQGWDANANSWFNGTRSTYTYTSFGKAETVTGYMWNGNDWEFFAKTEYAYDANHFLTFESNLTYDTEISSWVTNTQITYTNDNDGNQLQYILQQSDGAGWINAERLTQTFSTANKILSSISQTWTTDLQWLNSNKSLYSYDINDFLIHGQFQNWQTDSNSWLDSQHHDYTNNPDGTVSEFISQQWNGSVWANFQRAVYTYEVLGVAKNEMPSFDFYPNPVKDFVQISIVENVPARFTIIDLNGKIIRNLPISNKNTTVDLQELPTGIYLLLLEQQGKTQTKKFIKK
jgi:hypothetical protein